MQLPHIATAEEARTALDLICNDTRLQALTDWFLTPENIDDAIRGLDCVTDAETEQANRIRTAWQHHREALPPTSITDSGRLDLAKEAWDFRQGHERDAIPTSVELLPAPVAAVIYDLADAWGMTISDPPTGHFDVVLPIGGLLRANLARPATAARLLTHNIVTTRKVIGLTGHRQMTPSEMTLAQRLHLNVTTEAEALQTGLTKAFDLDSSAWKDQHTDGGLITTNHAGTTPVHLSVAPLTASGKRPTTGEAIAWMQRQGILAGSASILQITTPIYWIANHISVRTVISPEITLTTIGYDQDLSSGSAQSFRSQHYLQEIKAVVDALPRLATWANRDGT